MDDEYDGDGFKPRRTTTSVTAERDAEIARLRAELDAAKAEVVAEKAHASQAAAEARNYANKLDESRLLREKRADELDSARAELFAARNDILREGLARIEAEKQLAAARAALATEREACDNGVAALTAILDAWSIRWMPNLRAAVRAFVTEQQNRRAAEAKEPEHG